MGSASTPSDAARLIGTAPVTVREVTGESLGDGPPEIPWHLTPAAPGSIALQLRTTVRRVAIGAGLARNDELVETVRALPGVPAVVTSPAGGTFVIGGEAWLGLCAIGVPVAGQPMPLDWMLHSLQAWFVQALRPFGVTPAVERVDGGWCPGFSDIAVDHRKLVGLGFRMTKDWVVMRGVMNVRPMSDTDFDVLQRCHRLIDVEIRRDAAISLAEAANVPALTAPDVIARMRDATTDGSAPAEHVG